MATKHTLFILWGLFFFASSSVGQEEKSYSITVEINDLRNSEGLVQFALYNEEGAIPDEKYEKFFRMGKATIENGSSKYVFKRLPRGKYAVSILHDENKNGKIDKGLMLPKEGIGFSNYNSIGLNNRPNFKNAQFELDADKTVKVKVNYF